MASRKPYSGPRKLVLAFDVGTTYSGISYCILQPGQIPEIRGVTRFPGQAEGSGNAKVPSILYYDARGNVKAAGSEALSMNAINDAEDNGWKKAEWWKLHLRPKHLAANHIKDKDIPPLPVGKSAVDVLTDFIKYLHSSTRKYIEDHHIGFNWTSIQDSIEFIFSHPNGWEGLEQQKYREAIERAGLIPRTPEGRARVHMITEGEASLHYCMGSVHEQSNATGTQGVVIIDAGGGTIDLSMYSVSSNPVSCTEVAPAECRLQGAVFVTRRAANLLLRNLEGSRHSSIDEMDELVRRFDQSTKLTIRNPDEPVYLTVGDFRYNNPQLNIRRGALKLSGEDATSLFDESIRAIIDAFHQQQSAASTRVNMVFLVGGLGANDFVWNRLQAHFTAQGIGISRPDNDINKAVANGAVLFHLDCAVKSRIARATFGVRCCRNVDESDLEHWLRRDQWRICASGQYEIGGAFSPILSKGDRIDERKETRHGFIVERKTRQEFSDRPEVTVKIFSYRGDLSNPRWFDEDPFAFTELCTIRADMREATDNLVEILGVAGEVYYQADFEVVAFFGSTELTAQVVWKSHGVEERTPATIAYYDESPVSPVLIPAPTPWRRKNRGKGTRSGKKALV